MSTATLTKKELFVQGSLTTDVAEMIEILAVNVPGVKSCNVNASNKSLVLSIDSSKDESAIINELSSLIKTMDSSLQISTKKPANKTNKKLQGNAEEGDKKENITTSTPKALTKIGTTAIFKGKDFLGYLTEEESKVHSIIIGSTKESIINLDYKDNYSVFELYKIESDISPDIKDNKITLNISGKARIKEFHSNTNITKSKETDRLNKELNKHIEDIIKKNFNSMREKYNTDIFNFRQRFYRGNPK